MSSNVEVNTLIVKVLIYGIVYIFGFWSGYDYGKGLKK